MIGRPPQAPTPGPRKLGSGEFHKTRKTALLHHARQLGCIFVQEETLSDALFYVKEAIDLYFQSSIEHEDPIPDEVVISREVSEVSPTLPVKFNFASAYATSAVAIK